MVFFILAYSVISEIEQTSYEQYFKEEIDNALRDAEWKQVCLNTGWDQRGQLGVSLYLRNLWIVIDSFLAFFLSG